MVPASGDAHKNFHSPLAGIRSRIDNSACGDAIKILHSRERKFCNNFAEMDKKFTFPPRGNTIQNRQFRLRGMQSKFYIPRKRRFCNYFCAPSPRAEMHMKTLHFPLAGILSSADNSACGNATKILHLRERIFCNYFGSRSRLRKCTISCVSPRAEIQSGRRISASRICKRMCAVPQAVLQEIRSFLIPD